MPKVKFVSLELTPEEFQTLSQMVNFCNDNGITVMEDPKTKSIAQSINVKLDAIQERINRAQRIMDEDRNVN